MSDTTSELTNEILGAGSVDDVMEEKKEAFAESTLADYLAQMLEEHGLSKHDAIFRSEVDTVYGYQIFQGKKKPRRDVLLQLAFGMSLTVDETKRLLYYGNTGTLYPRVKRDAYLMYALHHHYSIAAANRLLYENGEETL